MMNSNKKTNNQIKLSKATKGWAVLFPLWIVLIQVLSLFPQLVEKIYSNGLYRYIRNLSFWITNWTSISLGDLFYIGFFSVLIFKLFRFTKKTRKLRFYLVYLLSTVSKIYFFFHLFWGMNYYRLDLNEKLEQNQEFAEEEFFDFLDETLVYSNELHLQLTKNDSIPVEFNYEDENLKSVVNNKILEVAKAHKIVVPIQPKIKGSLFSVPLTYAGFSGYVNPFTNESQYNNKIIDYKKPVTIVHEIAHQMGYAKENEANFVAYLVLLNSKKSDFKYAASTSILRHLLSHLYRSNRVMFEEYKACINFGIRENYKESQQFWDQYNNPVEPLLKQFYSSYLNINNQPEGMKSYSYVTNLLINYNKKNALYN